MKTVKGSWVQQIGLKTHHIEHNIRSNYKRVMKEIFYII